MTEIYSYLDGECKYYIPKSFFFCTLPQTVPWGDILDKFLKIPLSCMDLYSNKRGKICHEVNGFMPQEEKFF